MADGDADDTNPRYPRPELPVIYFDGIGKCSWNADTVRMYLAHITPAINKANEDAFTTSAMAVTSLNGFLNATKFFNGIALKMLKNEIIDEEQFKYVTTPLEEDDPE